MGLQPVWGRAFYLCNCNEGFPGQHKEGNQQHQSSDGHRSTELRVSPRCRVAWLGWEKRCGQAQTGEERFSALALHRLASSRLSVSTLSISKHSHTRKLKPSQGHTYSQNTARHLGNVVTKNYKKQIEPLVRDEPELMDRK